MERITLWNKLDVQLVFVSAFLILRKKFCKIMTFLRTAKCCCEVLQVILKVLTKCQNSRGLLKWKRMKKDREQHTDLGKGLCNGKQVAHRLWTLSQISEWWQTEVLFSGHENTQNWLNCNWIYRQKQYALLWQSDAVFKDTWFWTLCLKLTGGKLWPITIF